VRPSAHDRNGSGRERRTLPGGNATLAWRFSVLGNIICCGAATHSIPAPDGLWALRCSRVSAGGRATPRTVTRGDGSQEAKSGIWCG